MSQGGKPTAINHSRWLTRNGWSFNLVAGLPNYCISSEICGLWAYGSTNWLVSLSHEIQYPIRKSICTGFHHEFSRVKSHLNSSPIFPKNSETKSCFWDVSSYLDGLGLPQARFPRAPSIPSVFLGKAAGVVAQKAKATPKFRAFSGRRKHPISNVTSSGATLKLKRCSIKNLGKSHVETRDSQEIHGRWMEYEWDMNGIERDRNMYSTSQGVNLGK